jgi:hypothetical protein
MAAHDFLQWLQELLRSEVVITMVIFFGFLAGVAAVLVVLVWSAAQCEKCLVDLDVSAETAE